MKFKNIFVLVLLAVMALGESGSAESSGVQFRTLGWDVAPATLTLVVGKKLLPVSLEPRRLSPAYRGLNLLRFSTASVAGEEGGTFEVVVPEGVSTALLLFQASGTQGDPGYKVTVFDDSLAVFPLGRIRCLNLAKFPIMVSLLQESEIVGPEKIALWPTAMNVRRSRLSLSMQADSGWKEVANTTLDLMAQKRLNLLFFSEAGPVAAETLGADGSSQKMLIYPEKRPVYWFSLWDKGPPEIKAKTE